ncbi:MAG: ABC transporter ATP-binding protein [Bacillales bacterium]
MKVYKMLFKYVPELKFNVILSTLLSVSSAFSICFGYYFIYQVLVKILTQPNYKSAYVLSLHAILFLTIGALLYILSGIFSHILGFRLETNLRKKGIDGLINAGFSFFDLNESGIIRKTIDDNAAMTHQAVAHLIPDLGNAFITPILIFVLGFLISWKIGVFTLIIFIIGLLLMMKMMGGETSFMEQYQNALKRLSGETVEYVRGIQVIKIFKADVKSFKALYEAIMDYGKNAYAYSKSCKIPYVMYQFIYLGATTAAIIPLSFFLTKINNPSFLMIELIMSFFLLGLVLVSNMRIMYTSQYMFNAKYAVTNLEKYYDEMNQNKLEFGSETVINNYNIEFKNVTFSYKENNIFKDFSLKLEEGKTYALVGSSGSGKSTLAKLISGFYKIKEGNILIGDKNIEEYSEETISKSISFVFQDPKLFKISIFDNVALAKPDASREEVLNALKLARCDDIIDRFNDKENTLIGSKGVYLSGGEKQRIAIARAILKNSPILIMDEASASIDADNEYELQQSFKTLMKGKTVIMIAHRLSSIRNVDEIIVLKEGKVIERGNHSKLIENNNEYKKLLNLYNTSNEWRLNNETIL